jgi:hypothetical protein
VKRHPRRPAFALGVVVLAAGAAGELTVAFQVVFGDPVGGDQEDSAGTTVWRWDRNPKGQVRIKDQKAIANARLRAGVAVS